MKAKFAGSAARLSALLLCGLTLAACGEALFEQGASEEGGEGVERLSSASRLSGSARRARAGVIKRAASELGVTKGYLLAGIANHETGMAHCRSEYSFAACRGPASSACGGGPVLAGGGDGPCGNKQGGLGMFQFDGGTHAQTLRRDGRGILSVEGNARQAVLFMIDKIKKSIYIPGVSTDAQAVAWMNRVEIGGRQWDAWLKTVTHYYNGCPTRCSLHSSRKSKYAAATREVYAEFGAGFWDESSVVGEPAQLLAPSGLGSSTDRVIGEESLELFWGAIAGAGHYELEMQSDRGGAWTDYHTWEVDQTSKRVWPQHPDSNYRWRVRACLSDRCGAWSGRSSFVRGTPSSAPSESLDPLEEADNLSAGELVAPSLRSPIGGGEVFERSVRLEWEGVAGATRYTVEVERARDGAWIEHHTYRGVEGASKRIWPPIDNNTLRWRVQACQGSSCSPFSAWGSFLFRGL